MARPLYSVWLRALQYSLKPPGQQPFLHEGQSGLASQSAQLGCTRDDSIKLFSIQPYLQEGQLGLSSQKLQGGIICDSIESELNALEPTVRVIAASKRNALTNFSDVIFFIEVFLSECVVWSLSRVKRKVIRSTGRALRDSRFYCRFSFSITFTALVF